MSQHHVDLSLIRLPAIAAALAAGSLALPDPVKLATFLTSLGVGVGAGLGGGVAIFIQRTSAARLEAFKAEDAAHRESVMAKLEEVTRELDERCQKIEENTREIAELREYNERLIEKLTDFAQSALEEKGFLIRPPAPAPPCPGPDR